MTAEEIEDYFGEGKIETIRGGYTKWEGNYGYHFDDVKWVEYSADKISSITQDVASWLITNNYDDVQAVINSENSGKIFEVMAYFNTTWQQI